jgi:hypothetical protein
MKKFLLIPLLFLIPFLSHSQVEFNGMRVGESLEITKKNFIAKGFVQKSSKGNVITWEGTFGGKTGRIYTVSTPKSKLVWKFLVVAETHTDWYDTKASLNKYIEIFTKKYGAHSDQYFYFRNPYEEGDGHEMLALNLDKVVCLYNWNIPGGSILLEITSVKYGEAEIRISYEDEEVTKINTEEKSQIDNNTF